MCELIFVLLLCKNISYNIRLRLFFIKKSTSVNVFNLLMNQLIYNLFFKKKTVKLENFLRKEANKIN